MQEWLEMSAGALGRGIEAGEIDPVDLCEVYLAAIDAHEMTPRIYTVVTHDRARTEAAAASARAKAGQRLSLLDGVPVSWKDLFDSAGIVTAAGCRIYADRVPETDAEVLRVATGMGLVCLGKTHLSELAFSGLGLNPMTETSPCVNDHDAVAGGSSSGAATSVAFGLAAAAVGSDTGGSVRIPACWNDLVGLKTTIGRVSVAGAAPLCPSFDTVGPLCRTVEDAALMLAAIEDSAVPDLQGATLDGVRLMVLDTIVMEDLDAKPAAAFEAAVATLQAAGAVVERRAVPDLGDAFTQGGPMYVAEAYAEYAEFVEERPDEMFGEIVARIMAGKSVSAFEYLRGAKAIERVKAQYAEISAGFDAVIMPSSAIMPPNISRLLNDDAYYKRANLLALRNTRVGNLMGLCSISLPVGVPSCGIMLNATAGHEARLLRLAAAVEPALG